MIASALLLKGSAKGVSSYRIFGDEAYPQQWLHGMSGSKISHSEAIYLHLHVCQKWSYLDGQARVGLGVQAQ
jgi:hypothetical protein